MGFGACCGNFTYPTRRKSKRKSIYDELSQFESTTQTEKKNQHNSQIRIPKYESPKPISDNDDRKKYEIDNSILSGEPNILCEILGSIWPLIREYLEKNLLKNVETDLI